MALVQTVNPAVSTGTITATLALTLPRSLILVFIGTSALTDTVTSVTDNAGNTYLNAYAIASGTGGDTELWYCASSSSTTSVVVTFSASVTTKSVFVREYNGMSQATSCFDRTVGTNGSGTSVSTGASSAIRAAVELVVCSCSCLGTSPTLSVGAGFGNYTSQAILAGTALHSIQDLTTSSIGTQTGLMTAGGTLPVWDVGIATFMLADGKPGNILKSVRVGNGMGRSDQAS